MKRHLNVVGILFLVGSLAIAPGALQAQTTGDYGDAPEGALAYPSLMVPGAFPTCKGVGPSGFIFHGAIGNCAWFGPSVDFEWDGNAGNCLFPPYDQDECSPSVDNDAGLLAPDIYTIMGGAVVPCGAVTGRTLGQVCTSTAWGPNINIRVTNNCAVTMFVNVLMDWNMSGTWGGTSPCPLAPAPEWVLVNLPVPPGYNGPLAALGPAPFLVGPHAGYVWCRFTISNLPVNANDWDGSGEFEMGETEDYLLKVLPEETPGEYGDAPEGAIAYPSSGIMGAFPTCIATGPAGWVYHAPQGCCWFGPTVDFEVDGNAGNCVFPAYDQDECSRTTDNDAGLIVPDPFTIAGGAVVQCNPAQPGRALGGICLTAGWGPTGNVDIQVTNNCTEVKFVNVVMDWNQNGAWGGASACPAGGAPEWVLVNFPVPAGFAGPLSSLGPPSFLIGPNPGFVWARFTISDQFIQVPDWDGSGSFATGESEDYLLRVVLPDEGEYGDAPENAPAYPLLGVTGQFPTCTFIGTPASYVFHAPVGQAWFGPLVDFEADGNAGNCFFPPYDQDECGPGGGDAGLTLPQAYTIDATGSVIPCPPLTQRPNLGWYCLQSHWGANLDLGVRNLSPNTYFVNILADWDQNGTWSGSVTCPGTGLVLPEHLLVNLPVPPGYAGKLSNLISGPFWVPAQAGFLWIRCTISDVPVLPGWDGSGTFGDGETEDFLVRVEDQQSSVPELGRPTGPPGLMLEPNTPNPFTAATSVAFSLPAAGIVRVTVADIAGRVVRVLADRTFEAGRQTLTWDGRDDRGANLGSGLYFIRVEADGRVRTQKVLRTR